MMDERIIPMHSEDDGSKQREHIRKLNAENIRLREALEVLSYYSKTWGQEWFNADDWAKIDAARNALNQQP